MCTLGKCADNTKLEGWVNVLKGRAVLQQDLDTLDKQADGTVRNSARTNEKSCPVMKEGHEVVPYCQTGVTQ